MEYQKHRLSREYRLINYRTVKNLLDAQFLHDLYAQHIKDVNPFRYRNVIGVYDRGKVSMYTPESDWKYVETQISHIYSGEHAMTYIHNLEELFQPSWEFVNNFVAEFDRRPLNNLSNKEIATLLLTSYYDTLDIVFPSNRVPLEQGLLLTIKRQFDPLPLRLGSSYDWIVYLQSELQPTTAAKDLELIRSLANSTLVEGDSQFEDGIGLLQDHTVGYGSEARPRSEIINEIEEQRVKVQKTDTRKRGISIPHRIRPPADKSEMPERLMILLETYLNLGVLRDESKAQLGRVVSRRHKLLAEIGRRISDDETVSKTYLLEELLNFLYGDAKIKSEDIRERSQKPVLLRNSLRINTGNDALSIIDALTPIKNGKLKGLGVSKGIVEGYARISHFPQDVKDINESEILVVAGTDFNYISAMQQCNGILTVEGGMLSHASVICRELGVPCIVGVSSALTNLETGDLIQMNGNTGEIKVINRKLHNGSKTLRSQKRHASVNDLTDANLIGSKAFNLNKLANVGLLVAPFIVLDESFYTNWIRSTAIFTLDEFQNANNAMKLGMIQQLNTEVGAALLEMNTVTLASKEVSVRSSSLIEDGDDYSYAGIFETDIKVPLDSYRILESVKTGWISLFSDTVLGLDMLWEKAERNTWFMPLIIQEWIKGRISGVCFTKNPLGNEDENVIIELAYGACHQIVSGTECDERVSISEISKFESGILNDDQILDLVVSLKTLVSNFGEALDTEFSFDEADNLFFHQVRKVTTS